MERDGRFTLNLWIYDMRRTYVKQRKYHSGYKHSKEKMENSPTDLRLRRNVRPTAVFAYTNDVTVFMTKSDDIRIIRNVVRQYERASGACLNVRKSKGLAIGVLEDT
jgi:uncharacterized Fe-S radical SAM superfamily protein PflX